MKLGRFPRAAIVLAASLLSASWLRRRTSSPVPPLDIPENVQFVGKQDPESARPRRSSTAR